MLPAGSIRGWCRTSYSVHYTCNTAVQKPVQTLLCSIPSHSANGGIPEEYTGSPRTGPGDTVMGHSGSSKVQCWESRWS